MCGLRPPVPLVAVAGRAVGELRGQDGVLGVLLGGDGVGPGRQRQEGVALVRGGGPPVLRAREGEGEGERERERESQLS